MDSLRFGFEEHFDTFDYFMSMSEDESLNGEDLKLWDWDKEEEINGDVAVIPSAGIVGRQLEISSPHEKEDLHKIMTDWQQLINIHTQDMTLNDDRIMSDEFDLSEPFTIKNSIPSLFDLPDNQNNRESPKIIKHGGKKLDLNAQCYVVDENENPDSESENVDVETVTDSDTNNLIPVKNEPLDYLKLKTINKKESEDVINAFKNIKTDPKECHTQYTEINPTNIKVEKIEVKLENTLKETKQITDELLNKMKASGKRRSIAIIDVLPDKKRMKTVKKNEEKAIINEKEKDEENIKIENTFFTELVYLDHDYCGMNSTNIKHQIKDSGIESAEEEDRLRDVLRNQPKVKTADGTLMISLLKVNTIKRVAKSTPEEAQKKRKLNLEEYKKRREGFLKAYENSQNNSPSSSGRCSPAIEDENAKRLKHQAKLLQMAAELLKSAPKSKANQDRNKLTIPNVKIPVLNPGTDRKCDESDNKEITEKVILNANVTDNKTEENLKQNVPEKPTVPEGYITKTVVSIGVNTDTDKVPIIQKKTLNVSSIKQLEEIKPILKNANCKISSNSLIASVLENIQNQAKSVFKTVGDNLNSHGEDMTIVFLRKDLKSVKKWDVSLQTDFSEEWTSLNTIKCNSESGRSRRKGERDNSRDRSSNRSSRSSSRESRYSNTSSTSDTSCSISPERRKQKETKLKPFSKEHLKAVEDRRIIYVGNISSRTTRNELRRRFQKFGPITNINLHFRTYGDNYGFVTFLYKVDAYQAVEHGNDDSTLPKYDLRFGGRRIFCRTRYSDLDDIREDLSYNPVPIAARHNEIDSFDDLLREMQDKLCKRKST